MKKVLGRVDKADFPQFGLSEIDIKIDTGAYTSSLHCHHIEEKIVNDQLTLFFRLLDPSHSQYHKKQFNTKNYVRKKIRSSNGISQYRFIIKTTIRLFNKTYRTEFSLTERGEMKYPVLIGRKLLSGKFIVDTSLKNLSFTKMTSL